jgi:hypothetical protein
MTQTSVSAVAERQRIIRDALRNEWDPIGVGHVPEARDEYDAYAPAIYNLVVGEKPRDEIVAYLWWLETEQIGMPGDREGVERFADRLLGFREDFLKAR